MVNFKIRFRFRRWTLKKDEPRVKVTLFDLKNQANTQENEAKAGTSTTAVKEVNNSAKKPQFVIMLQVY